MKGVLFAFLTITALLVAGCVSSPLTPSASQGPVGALGATVRDAAVLAFTAGDNTTGKVVSGVLPVTFYLNHDAAEPTLGVTKDGTLLYAAATFNNDIVGQPFPGGSPRTDILRSDDGGLTWKDVTPYFPGGLVREHFETGDPYIYLDPVTDRVFDIDQRLSVTCHTVTYSDDKGASWNPLDAKACQTPPADHQTLVTGKPRVLPTTPLYPNIVYYCNNQIAASTCARSLDGGLTFHSTAPPFLGVSADAGVAPNSTDPTNSEISGFCGGLHGHLAAAPDGTVYLPKTHCGKPTVAVTKDDGLSWTTTVVAKANSWDDPTIAVDKANTVHMVYVGEKDRHLWLVSSKDSGAHWSTPLDVTAPGLTAANLPALTAGDEGRLALVYAGTADPVNVNIPEKDEAALNNETYDGYLAIITDAASPTPTVTTARVNPANDPLVRGQCGPARCPGMYDFLDVVMDKDGRAWAAFVDACIEKCAQPGGLAKDSNSRAAFVATFAQGPGLLANQTALPAIHGAGKS
ncbi:MAG: sialidase family protein [Candidatus Thermoplasmatota archaeon]